MTELEKCTYKELIEILLSVSATILTEKDLNAEIIPLKDNDIGSLVYILENIYYGQEEDTLDSSSEGSDKIIEEATQEYEATVDRPIQFPKEEEK